MAALVDDLFELSRINAGALRLSVGAVPLGDVVSDAVAVGRAARRAAASGCVRRRAAAGRRCAASEPELARVVANLLLNAIRYTPPDGTVTVTAGQDARRRLAGRHRHLRRHPRGGPAAGLRRGVPRRSAARTPAADDGEAGGGLGLAIVRGLVEAHGGEWRWTTSTAAAGSSCTCRLPRLLPAG